MVIGTKLSNQRVARTPYKNDLAEQLPLKILLVEDNAINQKVALLMLAGLGCRADVAGNGLEAVDAVRRQSYDLVLMDVQMPEMDGLDATRCIRSEIPSDRQPCIIAMTANATEESRLQCVEAGMDGYITKPVRREFLVEALRQGVGREAAKQERSAVVLDTQILRRLQFDIADDSPEVLVDLLVT